MIILDTMIVPIDFILMQMVEQVMLLYKQQLLSVHSQVMLLEQQQDYWHTKYNSRHFIVVRLAQVDNYKSQQQVDCGSDGGIYFRESGQQIHSNLSRQ